MNYTEYMNSAEWQDKRKQVLERAECKCEKCGFDACDVHHMSYERLGNENLEDLQALCLKCHWEAHGLPAVTDTLPAYMERMSRTKHAPMLGKFMSRILSSGDSQFDQVMRVVL